MKPDWYLRFYGDPILRQTCKPVGENLEEARGLARLMLENLLRDRASGMAACQYGESIRLFVVRLDDWHTDGTIVEGTPYVFINPKLSNPSRETEVMEEGCVSIPGVRLPVERPVKIAVEALDIEGNPFSIEPEGIFARVIMHENDHLNGRLIVDRTPPEYRKRAEPLLLELKKRYKQQKQG